MNIIIENIPAYRIAYIRQVGPYGSSNIQVMEEIKKWSKSKGLYNDDSIILGIARDNPATTKPEYCRYDTCIVISDNSFVIESPIEEGNIVGGKYAVFKISHTAEAIQNAWLEIFPELSRQGHVLDYSRPILERYIVKFVNMHYCEICVPIS